MRRMSSIHLAIGEELVHRQKHHSYEKRWSTGQEAGRDHHTHDIFTLRTNSKDEKESFSSTTAQSPDSPRTQRYLSGMLCSISVPSQRVKRCKLVADFRLHQNLVWASVNAAASEQQKFLIALSQWKGRSEFLFYRYFESAWTYEKCDVQNSRVACRRHRSASTCQVR